MELYCRTAVTSFRAGLIFSYSDRPIAGHFADVEAMKALSSKVGRALERFANGIMSTAVARNSYHLANISSSPRSYHERKADGNDGNMTF